MPSTQIGDGDDEFGGGVVVEVPDFRASGGVEGVVVAPVRGRKHFPRRDRWGSLAFGCRL